MNIWRSCSQYEKKHTGGCEQFRPKSPESGGDEGVGLSHRDFMWSIWECDEHVDLADKGFGKIDAHLDTAKRRVYIVL